MSTDAMTATQVYRVFIKATPQTVWDAITTPEWSDRYGYGGRVDYEMRPGGSFRSVAGEAMKQAAAAQGYPMPDVILDGEVIEADPPRRLVQTWRMLMDPGVAAEGFTRLTWEITETAGGVSRLTVTHELRGAPKLAVMVAGESPEMAGSGWAWVLSDLKTLLESGSPMVSGEWLQPE